jgi:hypothetical protein
LEHGATGTVFSGLKDLKRIGVALGQSLSGEGGLNAFELMEVQAGEAAMVGVQDFAQVAERGAENADGVKGVGLDLNLDKAGGKLLCNEVRPFSIAFIDLEPESYLRSSSAARPKCRSAKSRYCRQS